MGKARRETPPRREPPSVEPGRDAADSRTAALTVSALDALQAGQLRQFDDLTTELALRQVAEPTRRTTERVLRERFLSSTRSAWDRGWEPADLARLVGRELTAAHVPLLADLVADELSGYARATLDQRWLGQLRELESTAWWPADGTWLQARSLQQPTGWHGVVELSIGLLALLMGLPTLTPLGPLPGRALPPAAARTASSPGTPVDERILARVRALLAKAESTTFEAEAETFTAGAQALMARHSIDLALLRASAPAASAGTGAIRVGIDNPYEGAKATLLESVARANGCRSVWSRSLGFSTLVGYQHDLDAVETLFTSLLVQATRAMTSAGSRTDRAGRSRTRAFRQSFLAAYAYRIGERLQRTSAEQTQEAATVTGTDLLPVLAARDEQVDHAVTQLFPDLVQHRMRPVTDREGWISGTGAADRAVLQTGSAISDATVLSD